MAGRSRVLVAVLVAALVSLFLLAQLAGRPESQGTDSTPRFLTEELGSAHASAPLVRKPAPGLTLSVTDASFGLATELASVSLGTSGTGEWQRHESGATRPTAFGSETITFADESVEHYLTVAEHQGQRTWTWPIKASVKARLLDNGGVGFVDPKSHRVLDVELGKAQVFDANRKDVTPKGARWSLVTRGGAVLLALELDDAKPSASVHDRPDRIPDTAGASQNGAGSTSIAVAIAAAVEDGDLLLARVAVRSGTATVSDPSGLWTPLANTAITLAPGLTLQSFEKRATDADGNGSTSYTFNLSASVPASAGITAWSGVDNNAAVTAAASTVTTNSTQVSFPAVAAGSLRIAFAAHASTNTYPGTCSITCTLRGSLVNASGVGSGVYDTGAAFGAFTLTTGGGGASSRRAGHSISITTDSTAPSASVITFPAAAGEYNNTTFNAGCATNGLCGTATDTGSGIAQVQVSIRQGTGNYWNGTAFASAAEVFQTATVTGGTNWALTFPATNFPAEGNYTARVVATDNGGNANSGTSATFTIDRTVPLSGVLALNSVTPAGRAFLNGSTVWYRGVETGGGNFRIRDTVTDNVGGSGPGGSQTNALGGTTTGWTHVPSTVSTPVGGPFDSNTFTWVQNTTSSPTQVVNARDQAGNSLTLPTLTFTDDSATNAPVVTFPVAAASYNTAGWNAGCSTVPGDLCGTADDSAKSGIALVDVSIRQGAGNYWNGTSFASAAEVFTAATGTTSWSLGFAGANFPANGTYNLRVRTTDNVGNTAITTLAITIDNTAPVAPSGLASVPVSPANNNDPRFTGTAEALSTVNLYATAACTGGIVATGTAAAFASPGLNPVDIADNSTTSYSATATDAAGNVSACSSSISYVEDSAAPAAPSALTSIPVSPANNNDPRITGTAEALSTVSLYATAACTGGTVATGTAALFAGAGLNPTDIADNSTTSYSATATDAAGNVSACSSAISYVEDSIAPVAPTGLASVPVSPANNNDPRITGTAEALSTVSLYATAACTGGTVATGTAALFAGAGLNPTDIADNSTTSYSATATDAAGNVSACSSAISYVEDSIAPVAPTGLASVPVSPANNNDPRITGTAEALSTVSLYATAACTGGTVATGTAALFAGAGLNPTDIADNSTTPYSATTTDQAGNTSACSSAISYVEDSTAPAAPSALASIPVSPANNNDPRITGTAEALSTVSLYATAACTGGTVATGTAALFAGAGLNPADIADNSTTPYSATTTDQAGNTSTCSTSINYTEDSTNPASVVTFPTAGGTYRNGTWNNPAGTASDTGGAGLLRIEVSIRRVSSTLYWNGTAFADAVENWRTATGTAAWSLTFPAANFPADGDYVLRVRAIDNANNTQAATSYTVTIDNAAPNTTITAQPSDPTNSTAPSFSFTSTEGGSTFECQLDGGGYSACTARRATPARPRHHTPSSSARPTPPATSTQRPRVTPGRSTRPSPPARSPSPQLPGSTGRRPGTTSRAPRPTPAAQRSRTSRSRSSAPPAALYWNGSAFADAVENWRTATGTAAWSLTFPVANFPADGNYTIRVRATDTATNVQSTPVSRTFTIDTAAPNTTISAQPSDPTNSTAPSFSFTSTEGGSTFECQLDGGGYSACTSPKSYTGQTQASHTFLVRATDPAGNTDATPASYTWTIDTTEPTSTVSFPAAAGIYRAATWNDFSGTAADTGGSALANVQISIQRVSNSLYWNGTAFADAVENWRTATGTAAWSLTFPVANFPADGNYTIRVRATDTATNVETPASRTFTIDTAAPNTTISAQPSDPTNSTAPSFSFTSSEGGSTFECQLDGGGYIACTSPKSYTGQTQGSHTFLVRATDPAGNVDATPASFTWTIDTTEPTSTVAFPAAAGIYRTTTWNDFSGTAADTGGAALANVQISIQRASSSLYWNGSAFADAVENWRTATGAASWSLTFGVANFPADGNYTIRVRATDTATNVQSTPVSRTFTIDTAAPNTTISGAAERPHELNRSLVLLHLQRGRLDL